MNTEFQFLHLDGKTVHLSVRDGRIAGITPAAGPARQVIMPLPIEAHVHLDKTLTIGRCANVQPGLFGAIEAMQADLGNWTEADLRQRMSQGLTEAYASGCTAVRSHVDWWGAEVPLAWDVLGELAQEWRDRMQVQRSSLASLDLMADPDIGEAIARRVARDGEVLGCFIYRHANQAEGLARVFELAQKYDLWLDFHVDEGLEAEANAFDDIARLTKLNAMGGRVLCGHACSLSIRPENEAKRAYALAAEAGLAVTVMPTTNLWLQDSTPGRSPRLRGLAPMHELRAAGVPVILGADNVGDPFYPLGTYDALDVLRLATVTAHLAPAEWLDSITTAPARAMGLTPPTLEVGAPANFLLLDGSGWSEALRSPTSERRILRSGRLQTSGKEAA